VNPSGASLVNVNGVDPLPVGGVIVKFGLKLVNDTSYEYWSGNETIADGSNERLGFGTETSVVRQSLDRRQASSVHARHVALSHAYGSLRNDTVHVVFNPVDGSVNFKVPVDSPSSPSLLAVNDDAPVVTVTSDTFAVTL
jgi:hypothetical protein